MDYHKGEEEEEKGGEEGERKEDARMRRKKMDRQTAIFPLHDKTPNKADGVCVYTRARKRLITATRHLLQSHTHESGIVNGRRD